MIHTSTATPIESGAKKHNRVVQWYISLVMKTRQLHLMIEEVTYQALRKQAFAQGIPIGELVRRAIAALLAQAKPPQLQ